MINHITRFLLLFLLAITFLQQNKVYAWGWETHRYINENAVDYLPPEIDFFQWYKNERKDFTPIGKFLLTKQTSWKYEEEWRSIEFSKQQNSKGFLAPLKNNTIKAIIYGSKIKKRELDQLNKICKQKGIPLLKATADRENYKIVISERKTPSF